MRILQINAIYEKYSTGRTTKEMHIFFKKNGIESFVASPILNNLNENSYKIGNAIDRKVHGLLSRVTGLQGYYSIITTLGLIRYIKKIKPDLIHLRNLHSNYINILLLLKFISKKKIPIVITLHDCWFYTGKCVYYTSVNCNKYTKECGNCPLLKEGNISWFFDRTRKMLLDKKNIFSKIEKKGIIGVSEWITRDANNSILSNSSFVRCIYNWIDFSVFVPHDASELKKRLCLFEKKVLLGVATSWNKEKGIDLFFELARILPSDYFVVLVGDYKKEWKNRAQNIKFVGEISNTRELSDFYSISDIFLNPSIRETFGKTTAEAMSCGVPVVAFNSTATPELLGENGECGYLLDSNDPQEYLDSINKIERDRTRMKKNCFIRSRLLFDKETNINKYIMAYKELIRDKTL